MLLAAFMLRARDARYVFDGERVLVPGHDPHYHMRRIQHAVARWPAVPARDGWVNAPEGAEIYWPAGFDLALATLARVAGARAWTAQVERWCGWAMPVLGLGVVAATYWLGAQWRGRGTGLVAALAVAVAPMAISVSAVGRVDHDVAALLCAAVAYGCLLASLSARGRVGGLAWAAGGGAMLAAGLWVWPGAIAFVVLAGAFFVVRALVDDSPSEPAVAAMGSAAVLATLVCTLSASAKPGALSHLFLSGFHIILCWAGAVSQIMVYVVFRVWRPRRLRVAVVLGSLLVLAAAVAAVVARGLGGAGSFVSATADVTVSTTGEGIGLFDRGVQGVAADLSWAALAVPVGLVLCVWRGAGGRRRAGDWLVALWLVASVVLAAGQRRFAAMLSVPMGLCLGELAVWLYALAGLAGGPRRRLVRLALVVGAAVALATPAGRWTVRPYAPNWELRTLLPALEWLRDEAPVPGDARDFAARPRYAVMAFWHYGHWLTYVAGQANVACPFGNTAEHQRGLARSQAFFGARTEAAAAELCSRLGVRYVLSAHLPVPLLVQQAGLDPRRLAQQRVMATSLHLWRGLRAPSGRGPLERFRLVAEFEGPWPPTLAARMREPCRTLVFECVRGAVVSGLARPGAEVRLRVDLSDSDGRTLRYARAARADATGSYRLRVPYATEGAASRYRAAGDAHVTWSDGPHERRAQVAIPEAAVQSGGIVRCETH